MDKTQIRRVTPEDIRELQHIAKMTFYETFKNENTEADMKHYLAGSFSVSRITEELNHADSEFYFALQGEEVIGYLKINLNSAQTEIREENGLEIERIYVLREFHGKKVGQVLYNKALEIAKKKNVDFVWLGVWKHNPRAISFYRKNGFVEFDKHIFKLGSDEQTDIMMRMEIVENQDS